MYVSVSHLKDIRFRLQLLDIKTSYGAVGLTFWAGPRTSDRVPMLLLLQVLVLLLLPHHWPHSTSTQFWRSQAAREVKYKEDGWVDARVQQSRQGRVAPDRGLRLLQLAPSSPPRPPPSPPSPPPPPPPPSPGLRLSSRGGGWWRGRCTMCKGGANPLKISFDHFPSPLIWDRVLNLHTWTKKWKAWKPWINQNNGKLLGTEGSWQKRCWLWKEADPTLLAVYMPIEIVLMYSWYFSQTLFGQIWGKFGQFWELQAPHLIYWIEPTSTNPLTPPLTPPKSTSHNQEEL